MTIRRKSNVRKSRVETLELRALLSGDGILPTCPMEGDQPVEVGPPSEVVAAENGDFREEVEDEYGVDAPLGNERPRRWSRRFRDSANHRKRIRDAASNIDRDADSDVFSLFGDSDANLSRRVR